LQAGWTLPSWHAAWPLAGGSSQWLVARGSGSQGQRLRYALRLDESLQPLGASGDGLALQAQTLLPVLDDLGSDELLQSQSLQASVDRWWLSNQIWGRCFAEDAQFRHCLELRELDAAAVTPPHFGERRRLRLPGLVLTRAPLEFPDRVLLMTEQGANGPVRVLTVWR
jgi:hypothetical protein